MIDFHCPMQIFHKSDKTVHESYIKDQDHRTDTLKKLDPFSDSLLASGAEPFYFLWISMCAVGSKAMRIIRKKGRPQCYGYEKSQLKICTPENMGSKNITLTKH